MKMLRVLAERVWDSALRVLFSIKKLIFVKKGETSYFYNFFSIGNLVVSINIQQDCDK